ncbi:WD40 repeat domain-containing protein [Actinoplanes sp. NPDC051470]|uniref:WD40 repeat domain-containing protein n=1 Tax=Actinoplanes sp. NPDC051470 TaxID=3157224 RepID=UPI0034363EF0
MPFEQQEHPAGPGRSVESGWLPDPEAPSHLVLDGPITESSGDALVTVEGRQVLALPALHGSESGLVRAVDLATGGMLPDRALLRYDRHEVLALGAGRLLATLGPQSETVVVRDAVTGSPAGPPIRLGSRPRALALATADGRPVVATMAPGLSVWDVSTGALITRHDRFSGRHFTMHRGRLLVLTEKTIESLQAYDVLTGERFGDPIPCDNCMGVFRLSAVDHNGRLLVAFLDGVNNTRVTLWDATAGVELPAVPPFDDVRLIDMAMVNGRPLLLAGRSGRSGPRLVLWDPISGQQVLPDFFAGYDGDCTGLALGGLDDGFFAVTVDAGGTRLWQWSAGGTRRAALTGGAVFRTALGTVDGQPTVVLGDAYGELRLFDARTATEFSSPFYGGPVYSDIVGAMDSTLVLRGRPMRRWDLAAGVPVARLDRSFPGITSSATGRLDGRPVIAVVCGDRDVPAALSIWDPRADVLVAEVSLEPLTTGKLRPGRVVFTEVDGRTAAAVEIGSTVYAWDAATGEPCGRPYPGLDTSIMAFAAGRIGDRPVIAVSDGEWLIHLFDPATGEAVVPPMAGHSQTVTALALGMSDGRSVLVSVGRDNTVRVWDATTGEAIGTPWSSGHSDAIYRLQVIEWNGEPVVLSYPRGGAPRLWRLRASATDEGHTDAVRTVAAGRWGDSPVFASGGDDRTVRLWDAATGLPLGPAFTDHAAPVTHVAFSGPDRDILVTADEGGVVLRRQQRAGAPHSELLAELGERIAGIGTAEVDGRSVVGVATADGLRVWDAVTGRPGAELRTGADVVVNHADLGVLDGRLVALTVAYYDGDDDPMVALWDVATGMPRSEPVTVSEDSVTLGTLATLNGQLVAVQGDPQDDNYPETDAYVQVVDVATGAVLSQYPRKGGENRHATVARSAGREVVLIAADDAVLVMDPYGGAGEFKYGRHRAIVTCVAAAEVGGRTVVSSGDRGNGLHFWHLDTGERIR